jgi:hypothetical protein
MSRFIHYKCGMTYEKAKSLLLTINDNRCLSRMYKTVMSE